MRRGVLWRLGLGAMLAPAWAYAADAGKTAVLDFTAPGPLRDYLGLSMKVAWSYFTLAVIAAVVLEAIASGPGAPRNYAEVIWRIVLIVFLLWNYQRVFGFVMHVTTDIADRLTPQDALDEYHKYLDQVYAEEGQKQPVPSDSGEISKLGGPAAASAHAAISQWSVGNMLVDGFMGIMVLIAKGIVYALERLGRILAAVFFVVGPLALVAGIPRQSGTGGRWFRYFVSVSSWPIFSGLVLGVMTAVAKQSVLSRAGSPTANLVTAFVMILCALASPLLAGWIVGGATHGLLAAGLFGFMGLSRVVSKAVRKIQHLGSSRGSRQPPHAPGGSGPGGRGGSPGRGGGGQVAANPPGIAPRRQGGGYGPARGGGGGGGQIGRNAPGRPRWNPGGRPGQGQGAGAAGGSSGTAGGVAANPPSKPGSGTSANEGSPGGGGPSAPRARSAAGRGNLHG